VTGSTGPTNNRRRRTDFRRPGDCRQGCVPPVTNLIARVWKQPHTVRNLCFEVGMHNYEIKNGHAVKHSNENQITLTKQKRRCSATTDVTTALVSMLLRAATWRSSRVPPPSLLPARSRGQRSLPARCVNTKKWSVVPTMGLSAPQTTETWRRRFMMITE